MTKVDSGDLGFLAGVGIISRACQAPLRQIIKNAGADEIILHDILKGIVPQDQLPGLVSWPKGYDARKGIIVDMLVSGIIDPTKVVRVALENAVSAGKMLLTAEAVVSELPKKEEKKQNIGTDY